MTIPVPDDELTELHDATIPRVDLVDKAANGMRFLIAKQDEGSRGLLDPEYVRDLIAKAKPEHDARETVTMTGSPAAMAKMIHAASIARDAETPELAYTELVKAKYNADDRKRMAANGQAMANESYPIADRADLTRAISAVGRGGTDHDAIRRHVISRAKSLGATSEIPDNWNTDGSLKDASVSKEMEPAEMDTTQVAKDMDLDDAVDGMDPTVALAEPDGDAPGDPTDPGSPAWEAIDAATAAKWTSILARAKNALDILSEREMLEAASADPDDIDNAMDLQDACCAIDFAISVLAPFAVAEQAEADCCPEMAMVGKALGGFDPAPLGVIEALGQIRKAGRVLSAANEAAIRGAADSLTKVLASLPQAPTAPDDGQPVAKQKETTTMADNDIAGAATDVPATTPEATTAMGTPKTPATAEVPAARDVAKAEAPTVPVETAAVEQHPADVAKAKTPQVAIYDANGNLVGTVDPAEITTLAPAVAPDAPVAAPAADTDGDGTVDTDDIAPAAAPAVAADLTPAPSADAGTPADAVATDDDGNVTKTTGNASDAEPTESTTNGTQDVLKSTVEGLVKAALADQGAAQEQVIAKQAEDLAQQAKVVKTLEDRLKAVEDAPAVMAIASNGAIPQPHMMRGQANGAPVNLTEGQQLRKQLAASDDAVEKKQIADRMQGLAIEELGRLQAAAPQR